MKVYDINGLEMKTEEIKEVKDNYTGKKSSTNKLTRLKNIEGKYIYTSRPILVYDKNRGQYSTCLRDIENNSSYILHPSMAMYIKKGEKYVNNTVRPEKIYNLRNYNYEFDNKLEKVSNNLVDIIGNFTLGFELETSEGTLPRRTAHSNYHATIYDGSIEATEYVSVPFQSTHLHYLNTMLDLLYITTNTNPYCSFHIHIGNVPFSEENLLVLYTVFQRLQDEFNQIIPPYKKNLDFLKTKDKDHCKSLPKLPNNEIEDIYRILFRTTSISDLKSQDYLNSNSKWNILGRYFNVNFVNYILANPKSKTIEIRSLHATYNKNLIYTWLLINVCIIKYALKNETKILNNKEKILLEDILGEELEGEILSNIIYNIKFLKQYYFDRNYINLDDCSKQYNGHEEYLKNKLKEIYK